MALERKGVLPLVPVLEAIQAYMRDPEHAPRTVAWLGVAVPVDELRLQTFASHALECSEPNCTVQATHFAIERSPGPENKTKWQQFHLNLYGQNKQGETVMLTHDHTRARALGGADDLSNTTTMCDACNGIKARKESREVRRLRRQQNQPTGKLTTFELRPEAEGTHEHELTGLPSPRKMARMEEHFVRAAERMALSVAEYRQWCEQHAQPSDSFKQRTVALLMAKALGVSLGAFHYFKHEHNTFEKGQRQPHDEAELAFAGPSVTPRF